MNDEINLQEWVQILHRRGRYILLGLASALMLAFLFLVQVTPLYRSEALVLVDTNQKDLLAPDQGQAALSSGMASAIVESAVSILKSDAVLLRAIKAGDLLSDPTFAPKLTLLDKVGQALGMQSRELPSGEELLRFALRELDKDLDVQRKGLSFLISVRAESPVPQGAADLANLVAEAYIQSELDSKISATLAQRDLLENQLDAAQERLARSDEAVAHYIDSNIGRLERESGNPRVAELRRLFEQAQGQYEALSAERDLAQKALAAQDWAALTRALQDDALRELEQQRADLDARLGAAAGGSAVAVNLRAQLEKLEQDMVQASADAIAGLDARLVGLEREGGQARADLRQALLGSDLSADTLSRLYGLQQEATVAQRHYENLIGRIRNLEASAAVKVADSRVVSPAFPPSKPAFPNWIVVLSLAILLGLGGGLALALLHEFYIGGVASVAQLGNLLPIKVAGAAPRVRGRGMSEAPADLVVTQPMSAYAESFRQIRAALDRQFHGNSGRVVLVTSALPSEGKSVCALSLARTYALGGKRTLLIDADMRDPSQHKQLGLEPKSGLLQYVTQERLDGGPEIYQFDPKCNLGVILGSRRSDVPTDQLVQSEAFLLLLETARQSFDVIIIDGPPLLPVVDSRYIAAQADQVLLCVRANQTTQGEVRAVWAQFADSVDSPQKAQALLTFNEQGARGRPAYAYAYGQGDE